MDDVLVDFYFDDCCVEDFFEFFFFVVYCFGFVGFVIFECYCVFVFWVCCVVGLFIVLKEFVV